MEQEKITQYFRKGILAQTEKTIQFKEDDFFNITREEFISGNIRKEITEKLFFNNEKSTNEKNNEKTIKTSEEKDIDENMYVIIAPKVIKAKYEYLQNEKEEENLTGIFFIPAILNKKSSCLLPAVAENKLPWFPREMLKPMVEPELAIGDSALADIFLNNNISSIYQIKMWFQYIEFIRKLYKATTKCDFEEDTIHNSNGLQLDIELEQGIYIFADKTINPTHFIKQLYSDILLHLNDVPLYHNFISLEECNNRDLIENTLVSRKKHIAQMGANYGLSTSQREAVNHFNNMNFSEILAVNGPPGTGKTTLLQSIVANLFVEHALEEKKAPIIVATSTNNQAVTNIIESFGKIEPILENNLEQRWIQNLNSFAIYFPSSMQIKKAKENNYQYTDNRGNFFVSKIESDANFRLSKEKFLNNAEKLFGEVEYEEPRTVNTYKQKIYKLLKDINRIKNDFLNITYELSKVKHETLEDFFVHTDNEIKKLDEIQQNYKFRRQQWLVYNSNIPIVWRILAPIFRTFRIKISNQLKTYLSEDEDFSQKILTFTEIQIFYEKKIQEIRGKIKRLKLEKERIKNLIQLYWKCVNKMRNNSLINNIPTEIIRDTDKIDNWLDTSIRYIEFWLAVHYYEARWLEKEDILTDKQKGTTFNNVIHKFYHRLAMITPCMVMTFYILPKQFEVLENGTKTFLYNEIDLLIVDEAGQVSPEIAACSFALAKKAIIVGDENQIPPVWSIEKALDKSLALETELIKNENEFDYLQDIGINMSSSSVMKVACKSCNYMKYNHKGLFLSEHRRCYNDIIEYCNDLIYSGNLKPLRGNKKNDENNILPMMGYYQISSEYSERRRTSRINTKEAVEIANWIKNNYSSIELLYPHKKDKPILGIITPFKEQVNQIKKQLKNTIPAEICKLITVGTIHTFQGAEREIIIMSSTYGEKDGCFFIDNNKSLMNVAVSRAKDAFLLFGEINCLKDDKTSASGLLKSYIINNPIN